MAFLTSCISLSGATTCFPSNMSCTWFSDKLLPSMASELWIVLILLAFRRRSPSACSMRMAYRSICADISATRLIARELTVNGGTYPEYFSLLMPHPPLILLHSCLFQHAARFPVPQSDGYAWLAVCFGFAPPAAFILCLDSPVRSW